MRKIFADSGSHLEWNIQDPATPVAEGIIEFHHDLMMVMVFVVVFVGWMLGRILYHFERSRNSLSDGVVHGTVIEIVWTTIPALILMVIAVPSFALLYAVDEVVDPSITLKVIGRQWYWTYEYEGEEGELVFDSYMIPEEELEKGELRLLEVDNRIVLPVETNIRLVVTASDVLHCWTIPSFGVKIDACPGRLNQVNLMIKRPGVFYGQCSELCGVNHGFMPIVVEGVSVEKYIDWRDSNLE